MRLTTNERDALVAVADAMATEAAELPSDSRIRGQLLRLRTLLSCQARVAPLRSAPVVARQTTAPGELRSA